MALRRLYHRYQRFKIKLLHSLHNFFEQFSLYVGLVTAVVMAYDLGFRHVSKPVFFSSVYLLFLSTFTVAFTLRTLLFPSKSNLSNALRLLLIIVLLFVCGYKFNHLKHAFAPHSWMNVGSLAICGFLLLFDVSRKVLSLYSQRFNPALSFILSFLLLALIGAGLLMLPRATVHGLSFVDALFTSVSAVCVTGLSTVDVAVEFTRLGKIILLILIQLGGLGMLSFTSFFGYLYQGGFSIENQLFLKDIATSDRIGDVFRTLFKIIFITLFIELVGALFIYLTLDTTGLFATNGQRLRFAVFHSISAFCNAGFSSVPNGLYNEYLRQNISLHWVLMVLVIMGGIGFSIINDFYLYLKHYGRQLYLWIRYGLKVHHMSRSVSINTRLVMVMTALLLLVGTLAFWWSESNGALANETSTFGKITMAFFASTAPRSAGFTTFDIGQIYPATVLIFLLLMWIGAAPGSTGGGIKVTTFAVALLNVLSLAQGKDRVEVMKRRIPSESVRRAFAVITLSLLIIGPAILIITILEPEKPLIGLAFECFSAFGTAGMSLNLTPFLGDSTKLVLVVLMFVGRIGTFTLFVAFVRRVKALNYQYPNENVFIN